MVVPEGSKAGRITKPYGLRGEVNIILEPEAGNHIKPDNPLFIDIDGQRVPFFVEEVELLSGEQAIIKFEFIDTMESAREVSGNNIYFDTHQQKVSSESGDNLANLITYAAYDKEHGLLGKITDFYPHPMNPVFVIHSEERELMVPAVRDFIEQINTEEQSIHFILPKGLTSL